MADGSQDDLVELPIVLGSRRRNVRIRLSHSSREVQPSQRLSPPSLSTSRPLAAKRLPFEIIAQIFSDLVPTHLNHDEFRNHYLRRRDQPPYWLAISHVCRHWRFVALTTRSLWSYIPLENVEWTRLALAKSEPGPIRIDAGPGVARLHLVKSSALSLALAKAARAQHISIATVESTRMIDSLEALRAVEVPLLERLELLYFAADNAHPYPMISADIFRRSTPPVLHTLIILDVFVTASLNIFSAALTHLEMSIFTPVWDNLSQTLDTLTSLPNLEYLALMRGTVLPPWFKGDPNVLTGPRTVRLERLKTLRLNGDACVVLRLLEAIEAPICEVSYLAFALEQDFVPQDPEEVAAGLTHERWLALPSIPSAIASACMFNVGPSRTMTDLVISSAMDAIWPTIGDLTSFMRSVPNLRALTIRGSPWHELPLPPTDPVEPIRMDHLQRLHLWSRFPSTLSTISDHIILSENASRVVTIDGGPPDGMLLDDFARSVRMIFQLSELPSDEQPSYRRIAVTELRDNVYFGVCITVSEPSPSTSEQNALPPSMELNIPLFTLGQPTLVTPPPQVVERLAELIPVLVAALPLQDCSEVSVEHLLFEELDIWRRTFTHLTAVTKLTVRPGPKLAGMAARALCASRAPDAPATLFPDLANLHLERVDFADGAFVPCPFALHPDRMMTNCVKFALEVTHSYIEDELLSLLKRDFVKGFRWDGVRDVSAKHVSRSWRQHGQPLVHTSSGSSVAPIALTIHSAASSPS